MMHPTKTKTKKQPIKQLFHSMQWYAKLKIGLLLSFALFSLMLLAILVQSNTANWLVFLSLIEIGASVLSNLAWLMVRTACLSQEPPTLRGTSQTNYFLIKVWWFFNNLFLTDGLISLFLSMRSGLPTPFIFFIYPLPTKLLYGFCGAILGGGICMIATHLISRAMRLKATLFNITLLNPNSIPRLHPAKGSDNFILSPNPIQFKELTLDPFRFNFDEATFPFEKTHD